MPVGAQPVDQRERLRHRRGALALVQPVVGRLVAAVPGSPISACTSSAARAALYAASACGTTSGSRPRATWVERVSAGTNSTGRISASTPIRAAPTPSAVIHDRVAAAEQAGCDVVGVPLELGGEPEDRVLVDLVDVRAQRPRADHTGHDGRCRGTHPPSLRDPVVGDHPQPGRRPAQLVAGGAERADDEVRLVRRAGPPRPLPAPRRTVRRGRRRTRRRRGSVRASPAQSKAGPRLALVAGTRTLATVRGRTVTPPRAPAAPRPQRRRPGWSPERARPRWPSPGP